MLAERTQMTCPSCSQAMARQDFERSYGAVVAIDVWQVCGAFWFDRWEDLILTPGALLRLFVVMNDKQPARPKSQPEFFSDAIVPELSGPRL